MRADSLPDDLQDGHEAPSMADVNLGLGEWEGAGGGLKGHMECSLDVFDVAGAERFTSSFKVPICLASCC